MFRRDFKLFIKCLFSASLILVALAALFAIGAGVLIAGAEEKLTPVKVIVVDNEDSVYSRILINAIGGMDYVGDFLKIERMGTNEADIAMANGECSAMIILPDGFIDDILSGEVSRGRILISPELRAHGEIVAAVASFGERILASGQYGTFSGLELIRLHSLPAEIRQSYLGTVNSALLGEAIDAGERYFDIEIMDYWDTGMTTEAYYVMCWLVMLLFLISVFFIPLYTTDLYRSMINRLRSCGVGNVSFLVGKLTLTFLFRVIVVTALFVLLGTLDIITLDIGSLLSTLAAILYITVAGMAVTVCFGDGITGSVIVSVGGMFLCGGLIPRQLLPKLLLRIGDLTPYGAAKALLAPVFGGEIDYIGAILSLVYAVLAILLIRAKFERTRIGKE